MTTHRRIIWVLTLAAFLVLTSGCSSTHTRTIQFEIERDGTGLHKTSGQKIKGYELHDGVHTDYKGWARVTNRDSLALWSTEFVAESISAEASILDDAQNSFTSQGPVFSLAEVKNLDVVESSPGKTLLAVIATPFVLIVVVVGVSMIAADSGNLY